MTEFLDRIADPCRQPRMFAVRVERMWWLHRALNPAVASSTEGDDSVQDSASVSAHSSASSVPSARRKSKTAVAREVYPQPEPAPKKVISLMARPTRERVVPPLNVVVRGDNESPVRSRCPRPIIRHRSEQAQTPVSTMMPRLFMNSASHRLVSRMQSPGGSTVVILSHQDSTQPVRTRAGRVGLVSPTPSLEAVTVPNRSAPRFMNQGPVSVGKRSGSNAMTKPKGPAAREFRGTVGPHRRRTEPIRLTSSPPAPVPHPAGSAGPTRQCPEPRWRTAVRARYPHWSTILDQQHTRLKVDLHTLPWGRVIQDLHGQLEESRAPGTWATIASVVNQFLEFDTRLSSSASTHHEWNHMEMDWRMLFFVQYKIVNGLQVTSAIEYVKKLRQLHRLIAGEVSEPSFLMTEYLKSLHRDPLSTPVGARPLTPEELQQILHNLTRHSTHPAWVPQITCMWITASRADDLHRLEWEDIQAESDRIVIRWDRGTKSGVDKRMDYIPIALNEPSPTVTWLKSQGRLDGKAWPKPFPLDANQVTQLLKKYVPDASSHSIKKGALVALMDRGASIAQTAWKAKHATDETLQTYVGSRAWADAHQAMQMSNSLGTLLRW